MNIQFDPAARRISTMRAARFAPEDKPEAAPSTSRDAATFSQAGRQAVEDAAGGDGFEEMAQKLEKTLSSMTKTEFQAMVRRELGEQKLEINEAASVDPDGSVWAKAYMDSLASQCRTARSAVETYYTGAYQEALHSPLGDSPTAQLNFLAGKYLCSWSDCFDAGMSAGERQWTYNQVKAMLTGGHVKLNDPYALAAGGLDVKNMDETARQTASDHIAALFRASIAE